MICDSAAIFKRNNANALNPLEVLLNSQAAVYK